MSKPNRQWMAQPYALVETRNDRLATVAEVCFCDAPLGQRRLVGGTVARSVALRRRSELPVFARVIVRHGDIVTELLRTAVARIGDELAA